MKVLESYPVTTRKIHNEFITAPEKLLQEAQSIINRTSNYDIDKVKRLKSIGFTGVPQVVDTTKQLVDNEKATSFAQMVVNYKNKYPNNPFITNEQVERICKKYDLVHGPLDRFIGFVPERNLAELETFKVDKKDAIYFYKVTTVSHGAWDRENVKEGVKKFLNSVNNIIDGDKVLEWYLSTMFSSFKEYNEIIQYKMDSYIQAVVKEKYGVNSSATFNVDPVSNLTICAPEKDFNMNGMGKSGFSLFEIFGFKEEQKVKDPVVLERVIGGYIVRTAWGDEANDPIVKGEE